MISFDCKVADGPVLTYSYMYDFTLLSLLRDLHIHYDIYIPVLKLIIVYVTSSINSSVRPHPFRYGFLYNYLSQSLAILIEAVLLNMRFNSERLEDFYSLFIWPHGWYPAVSFACVFI